MMAQCDLAVERVCRMPHSESVPDILQTIAQAGQTLKKSLHTDDKISFLLQNQFEIYLKGF